MRSIHLLVRTTIMLVTSGYWWLNFDVGDIFWIMVTETNVKRLKWPNPSPTSYSGHQYILSLTSVTNIDVPAGHFSPKITFSLLPKPFFRNHSVNRFCWFYLTRCWMIIRINSVIIFRFKIPNFWENKSGWRSADNGDGMVNIPKCWRPIIRK